MSTPPTRARVRRSEPNEESTQIRRRAALPRRPPQLEVLTNDDAETWPSPPPSDAISRVGELERTLRFARLVRDTLVQGDPLTHLLDLALTRRDAVLLRAILKQLYEMQQASRDSDTDDYERSDRHTLLPPPPKNDESER